MSRLRSILFVVSALLALMAAGIAIPARYQIMWVSTGKIKIGDKTCHQGDVCRSTETIHWDKNVSNQTLRVRDTDSGKCYIMRHKSLNAHDKDWNFKRYFVKVNPTSVRGLPAQLLAGILRGDFYFTDSLEVTFPYHFMDSCRVDMTFDTPEGRSVTVHPLIADSTLVITAPMLGVMGRPLDEVTVRPRFKVFSPMGEDSILGDTYLHILPGE